MEADVLKKYYAKGYNVVLSGKSYKHGEPLPKRKDGAYDCLVDNRMATFTEEKESFKASADGETFISSANDRVEITTQDVGSFEDAMAENQIVNIKTKKFRRGKD